MCYCPSCCYTPAPVPYFSVTTPQQFSPYVLSPQALVQQPPNPPPVTDETWHHGYTCCNCQECCDFRDCCNCSGCCYDCNVGKNSNPLFNSKVGPLYQYYDDACCRSCVVAPYSGSSCMGSLFPCCLNNVTLINQPTFTQISPRPVSPLPYMITTASTIPSSTHLLPLPIIKPLPVIHNIPPPITQVIRPVSPGQIIQQQLSSRPNTVRISPSPLPPLIKSPIRPPGTIPFTRTI